LCAPGRGWAADLSSGREGAYVRHYEVTVPRDAVAHIHPKLADAALKMMDINMRAEITDAATALAGLAESAEARLR